MTKAFNWQQVIRILGLLLLTEATFLLLAAGVSFIYQENDFGSIIQAAGITAGVGLSGLLIGGKPKKQMGIREGYLIVGFVWIVFSFFGMLPFVLSGYIPSVTDAYFETMSGFTTTGASILNDIESLPHGLLFWRSLIQWIGGMGIVVLSLAVLPMFGGGMQLYVAEVPGLTYDKIQPRIQETARRLWGIYLIITCTQVILLNIVGMDFFDAVCHSLTTMSSGGYSTKQASIAHWDSATIQYIIIFFMTIAGINFSLIYYSINQRNFKKIFHDEEFRTYILTIIIISSLLTIGLTIISNIPALATIEQNFRCALFQTVSILTTTGFATADYMIWPPILWLLLLFAMLFGGSAGSTAGGMKMARLLVIVKNLFYEFKRIIHPKAIIPVRINRRVLPENIVTNVHAFVTIYVILIAFSIMILMMNGMDIQEALGAALTSISNVGPGLGAQGPAGNFAMIPTFAKWYLSFLMLIGRLELFTILLLFSPSFWRK